MAGRLLWPPELPEAGLPNTSQASAPTPGIRITVTAHNQRGISRTRAGSACATSTMQ